MFFKTLGNDVTRYICDGIGIHGLGYSWHVVFKKIGYYLVNGSCDSEKVKKKLFELLDKLNSIGLNVVAVISNLGSNFQKFINKQ